MTTHDGPGASLRARLTDDELDALLLEWRAGGSPFYMAKKLGVTDNVLSSLLNNHELTVFGMEHVRAQKRRDVEIARAHTQREIAKRQAEKQAALARLNQPRNETRDNAYKADMGRGV